MISIIVLGILLDHVQSLELTCPCYNALGDTLCDPVCNTKSCNYDSSINFQTSLDFLKFSDCAVLCTSFCDYAKLGNGICDQECDLDICGYDLGDCGVCISGCTSDLLGNGICDESCNYSECNHDLNDCGWCAEGCFYEMLEDGICQDACFNDECSYDESDCSDRLCATDCYPRYKGNDECDQACDNIECNFDDGECDCSSGCTYELRSSTECVTECNTESCNYHDGQCSGLSSNNCATGCSLDMIGDGICDESCKTEACKYDYTDCGCSPGCYLDETDPCDDICMDIRCDYKFNRLLNQDGICYHSNKGLYNFQYQMITNSFDSRYALEECLLKDSTCDSKTMQNANNGICTPNKCLTDVCLYQLFACSDNICPPECEKCTTDGRCVKCRDKNKVQMFTNCINECPIGFIPIYVSVVDRKVCYFSDKTTISQPKVFYVKSNTARNLQTLRPTEDGSSANPFSSLSLALMHINSKFSTIYLLDGYHELFEDNQANTLNTDPKNPLSRKYYIHYSQITIQTAFCTDFPDLESCAEEPAVIQPIEKITLTLNAKKFIIQDVRFDGSKLVCSSTEHCSCQISTCQYCPTLYQITGGSFTDHNEYLDTSYVDSNYSINCQDFSNYAVIESMESSDIYISNVAFENFTYKGKALIKVKNANLYLKSVDFKWIVVAGDKKSAVVSITGSDITTVMFEYNSGLVQYLNEGYELTEYAAFRGFLYASTIKSCKFEDIEFSYNLVHIGSLSSFSGGTADLIYAESIKQIISLENVRFLYNYVDSSIINVENSYISYNSIDMQEYYNYFPYFESDQFLLQNVSIAHCSSQNSLIRFKSQNYLQNVSLLDVSISHSISANENIIDIANDSNVDDTSIYGGYIKVESISTEEVYFPYRYLNVKDVSLVSCHGYYTLIYIDGFPNASFENISIEDSGDTDGTTKNWVESLTLDGFKEKELYVRYGYPKNQELYCDYLMIFRFLSILKFSGGRFINSYCLSTLVLITNSEGELTIADLQFSDITASINGPLALYISEITSGRLDITNCTFRNITNNSNIGAVYIKDVTDVQITDTHFYNVRGQNSGAIKLKNIKMLTIQQSSFQDVESFSKNGAALEIILAENAENANEVKIIDTTFENCDSKLGSGCIYIGSSSTFSILRLDMSELSFKNCSSIIGSAVFLSQSISLKIGYIDSITVSSNYNTLGAPITTGHTLGPLEISNSLFTLNTGKICAIMSIFESNSELMSLMNVTVSYNSCTQCCISVSSSTLKPIVRSKNLNIIGNKSVGVKISEAILYDSYSIYEGNEGALEVYSEAYVEMESVMILNNVNTGHGGSVSLSNNSGFKCMNCKFRNNQGANAGAISAEQNSYFYLENGILDGNIATRGESAINIVISDKWSQIHNCQIINNQSENYLMMIGAGKLELDSSLISNNQGSISISESEIKILNCTFLNPQSSGFAYLEIESESTVIIEYTSFLDSVLNSTIFSLSYSNIECTYCTFHNITFLLSEGIFSAASSEVVISYTQFTSIMNKYDYSVIHSDTSYVEFDNVIVDSYSSSVIKGHSAYSIIVKNSVFSNGVGYQGSAIVCLDCFIIDIYNSKFINNEAQLDGGAIYISGEGYYIHIEDCLFVNNTAYDGGALVILDSTATVTNCEFRDNTALNSAGAMMLKSTKQASIWTINDSIFIHNNAETAGGAIYWRDYEPKESNNIYINNTAYYGPDKASYPIKLLILQDEIPQDYLPYNSTLYDSKYFPLALVINGEAPGQEPKKTLGVALVDHYGQIYKIDNSSSAEVSEVDVESTVLSGQTKAISQNGVYTFDNIILQAKPNSSIYIAILTDSIDSTKIQSSGTAISSYNKIFMLINLRACIIGETDQENVCKVCESDTYSLDPTDPCSDCPSEAYCLGNYTMYPKKGYWRTSEYSDVFYTCPNENACLGSPEYTNYIGSCSEGYQGNMCQPCAPNYSRASANTCSTCPDEAVNVIRLIGVILLVIAVCVILVFSSLKSAYQPKSLHSIYFKILTNYIQLVTITSQFNLEWPKIVLYLLDFQRDSGSITDQLISLDCYLSDESENAYKDVYYQKIIMLACIPAILFVCSYLFWLIVSICKSDWSYLNKNIASYVVLFFLMHPYVSKGSFSIFSCMEIEGEGYYLRDNLDIKCWEGDHTFYSVALALPCIVVWVIGVPAIVLAYLCKHKNKLTDIENKLRFGFLYNGYKQNRFYWEFVILYRKIILIAISVFFSSILTEIQALTAMLVLIGYLHSQLTIRPYSHKMLNTMEARGILASAVTIYCGLYFLTSKLNEPSKYFFFILMILVNIYFIGFWLYHTFKAIWTMIKLKIKNQIKESPDNILAYRRLTRQVYFVDEEKMCTLYHNSSILGDENKLPENMHTLYKEMYLKQIPETEVNPIHIGMDCSSESSIVIVSVDHKKRVKEVIERYYSSDEFEDYAEIAEEIEKY